jgi:hypothetical protein
MEGWPSDRAVRRAAAVLGNTHEEETNDAIARRVLEAAGLPELMGTAAVAEAYGTTTANLRKWSGVPAPLYDLPAGRFYDADVIRADAARRREGAAA